MPVVRRSNNRVIPANSRNVDVAKKTIREIIDVQQQKAMNAFRVQGFQAVLYSKLNAGKLCSCQSKAKQTNTRLDKDGKAKPGFINELLTGASFSIEDYGSSDITIQDLHNAEDFNLISESDNPHVGRIKVPTEGTQASMQEVQEASLDLDDMVGDLDPLFLGFNDVACAVCFGSGYVGGFSVFNGVRIVKSVSDVSLSGNIDVSATPWKSEGSFSFKCRLPLGAVGVDTFTVYNQKEKVNCEILIDGHPASIDLILSKCDGKEHLIEVNTSEAWTHVVLQFATSNEPAYFEFPRMSKSYNDRMFDETEPFSIHMGPNVPSLQVLDVLVDSTYGKAMVVTSTNPWNTKEKNNLGFTCQVRVCQPMELYTMLDGRKKFEHGHSTLMVRQNQ